MGNYNQKNIFKGKIEKDQEKILKIKESYNEITYRSVTFPSTHPYNLSMIATLLGLEPENIETANILEIGCSFGGNIIPIAINYPNVNILGIDLSDKQVEVGNEAIKHIGLKNIRIECHDVTNFKIDEKFDYIICHGVYSWVPDIVKESILKLISDNLSEKGLAYVSYNTYPGWKLKEIFKDAMKYHVKNKEIDDTSLKVDYANSFIKFLEKEYNTDQIFSKISDQYSSSIYSKDKFYLAHEYLEGVNDPCYFYEFMEKAHSNNLGFVSEAYLGGARFYMPMSGISIEAMNSILNEAGNNQEKIEQYYDFLIGTVFRETILTHEKNTKNLLEYDENIQYENVLKLHIIGKFELDKDSEKWTSNNVKLKRNEFNDFVIKKINESFPNSVSISYLFEESKKKFSEKIREDFFLLIRDIIFYTDAKTTAFNVNKISTDDIKPKIPEKVRKLQEFVYKNPNTISLSNIYHESIGYGEELLFDKIFQMLDGSNDKESIYNKLMEEIENGEIIIILKNESDSDMQLDETVRKMISETIEYIIDRFLLEK